MTTAAILQYHAVILAKAGIQCLADAPEIQSRWIPALAGMTSGGCEVQA
jgi:hypothetical protein